VKKDGEHLDKCVEEFLALVFLEAIQRRICSDMTNVCAEPEGTYLLTFMLMIEVVGFKHFCEAIKDQKSRGKITEIPKVTEKKYLPNYILTQKCVIKICNRKR